MVLGSYSSVDSNRKVSDIETQDEAQNIEEHIALGVLYKIPLRHFSNEFLSVQRKTTLVEEVHHYDITNSSQNLWQNHH